MIEKDKGRCAKKSLPKLLCCMLMASMALTACGSGQNRRAGAEYDDGAERQASSSAIGETTVPGATVEGTWVEEEHPAWNSNRWLAYVTDEELFYVVNGDKSLAEKDELWSIPLEEEGHRPQMDRAEKILEEKGTIEEFVYADSQYIAYTRRQSTYIEYDRGAKKRIGVGSADEKTGNWQLAAGVSGNTVLLTDYPVTGTYAHTVGSGRVQKIEKNRVINAERCLVSVWGDRLFYTGVVKSVVRNRGDAVMDDSIYVYDSRTEKKSTFLKKEKWQDFFEKETNAEAGEIEALFTAGGRLYITAGIWGEEDALVMSCPLEGRKKLRAEKELSQFLGQCEDADIYDMIGNRCLIWEEGEEGTELYSWRLDTGEYKKLESTDPERFLWGYGDYFTL